MAVERLEAGLEPVEERVARRRVAGEVGARELVARGAVAVLGAPEGVELGEAALDARPLGFAVAGDELGDERIGGVGGEGGGHQQQQGERDGECRSEHGERPPTGIIGTGARRWAPGGPGRGRSITGAAPAVRRPGSLLPQRGGGVALGVDSAGPTRAARGNIRAGFAARTANDRKAFGPTWNQALGAGGVRVGDKVKIEIEAVKPSATQAA